MSPSATAPAETRTHRLLGDPSRARILQLLQDSARPLAVADVAADPGLHATTARFHLELLADAELAHRTTEVRTTRGRPRTFYAAVPPAPAPDASYQILAEVLAERLAGPGGPATAMTAGYSWGERLEPAAATPATAEEAVARLGEVLTDAGFAPTTTARGDLVLHACPFVDAARRNPDVVCSVHLGLAQGVLHRLGAPVTATALRPRLDGPACLLRLEHTASRHNQGPDIAGPGSSAAVSPRSGRGSG